MDLSGYSNEELMALAGVGSSAPKQPRGLRNNNPLNLEATVNWTGMQGNDGRFAVFPDMETGVAAADRNLQTYHQKYGINTVEGIVNRWAPPTENNSRAYAQTVAQKIGVDPSAPLDMADPQVRRSVLDAMADVENGRNVDLGAAPMQQADLSGFSDEELMRIAGVAPKAQPKPNVVASSRNGGVTIELPGENPTVAQDALSGFLQPFKDFGSTVQSGVQKAHDRALAPLPKLSELPGQFMGDLRDSAALVGSTLGMASAPIQAVVRPAARAVNRATAGAPMYDVPTLGEAATGAVNAITGKKSAQFNPLTAPQRQTALEGDINLALSAAKPASARYPQAPKAGKVDIGELEAAKNNAYRAVDNSGVKFWPQETDQMIDGMRQTLAANNADPVLNQRAMRAMDLLEQRKGKAMTLSEVDDLRKIVSREVLSSKEPGDQFFGKLMQGQIDGFLDGIQPNQIVPGAGSQDPGGLIRQAREANRKYRNVEEVMKRTDSAELRASSTYAGGNQANATRQNLRPLIDPKSPQRLKGLSPEEAKALNRVVRGTAGQNLMRVTGKTLDPRGMIGSTIQGALGLGTHGLSTVTMPFAMLASEASNKMTAKAVADALQILAGMGGKAAVASPTISKVPLLSAPGVAGAGVVAAPLTRMPAESPTRGSGKTGKSSPPRKQRRP